MVEIKRAYEEPSEDDGHRVLVDRLWPRGIKKESYPLEAWMKELAPSTELRKDFGHDAEKWKDFRSEYKKELRSSEAKAKIRELVGIAKKSKLTLIYGARDEKHNNAVVLKDVIEGEIRK